MKCRTNETAWLLLVLWFCGCYWSGHVYVSYILYHSGSRLLCVAYMCVWGVVNTTLKLYSCWL